MNFGGTIKFSRTGWLILFFITFLLVFIHFRQPTALIKEGNVVSVDKMVQVRALFIGAIAASYLGGNKVIAGSKGELYIHSKGKTLEGVNDPVTNADFASHCDMFYSLSKEFPDVHIRSEEDQTKETCPEPSLLKSVPLRDFPGVEDLPDEYVNPSDVTIWIDPLDATKEYTEKLYEYVTTMVCVAVKGVPIIGVIHHPFLKTISWAWLTKSISPELQLAHKESTQASRENPVVIVSISHKGQVEELVRRSFGAKTKIVTAAGAGHKVLEVAQGNADIYLHKTHIKKWDICAGNAIMNAIGGRMTTLLNETIDYSSHTDALNKDGLLVSVKDHDFYYKTISKANKI